MAAAVVLTSVWRTSGPQDHQGPEVEPTDTGVRKVAPGHALLSYAFGTGIVAVAINLVTNLGQA